MSEKKGHILLMDDEDIILKTGSKMLEHFGHTVTPAKDGEEAIDLYSQALNENNPFDIVIMDLTIPGGLGGKEAIEKLKKIDPMVRAIVSSGYSDDPIMGDYGNYGFSGIIVKPYTMESLNEEVTRLL